LALLLTLVFSTSYRHQGPLGGLLLFFLIIFLATWAGQLWISPIGPLMLGIAWGPLVFVAFLFAILLMALAAGNPKPAKTNNASEAVNEGPVVAIGMFFWFLLVILLVAIAVGYYRHPEKPLIAE
ncbi:MAG TPA: hypothetical protein VI112_04415, partial [Bacteroidia bacterium]